MGWRNVRSAFASIAGGVLLALVMVEARAWADCVANFESAEIALDAVTDDGVDRADLGAYDALSVDLHATGAGVDLVFLQGGEQVHTERYAEAP